METSGTAVTVGVKDSFVLNELSDDSDRESKHDLLAGSDQKMDKTVPDNQAERVSNLSKMRNGPRPPKPRPDQRIASVTDNPFYKFGGGRSPRSPRTELPALLRGTRNCFDTDDLGGYKPGSGYVHKLSGKFSSLGEGNEPKLKHAASVDDILDERKVHHPDDQGQQQEMGHRWVSSLSHRAGSVESLDSHRKTPPVFPVSLRHVQRKWEHDRKWEPPSSPQKSPRDTHVVAPDIQLARDDIILIENPPEPTPPSPDNDTDEEVEKNVNADVSSCRSEVGTDNLPKPNTVSAVRSMFESVKSLSSVSVHPSLDLTGENGPSGCHGEDSDTAVTDVSSTLVEVVRSSSTDLSEEVSNLAPRDRSRSSPTTDIIVITGDSATAPRESSPMSIAFSFSHLDISHKTWSDSIQDSRKLVSDVKTVGSVDSDSESSRSSTPPPLPLSPPPPLPLSPPPSVPLSSSMESSTVVETIDTMLQDVRPDVSEVEDVRPQVSTGVRAHVSLSEDVKADLPENVNSDVPLSEGVKTISDVIPHLSENVSPDVSLSANVKPEISKDVTADKSEDVKPTLFPFRPVPPPRPTPFPRSTGTFRAIPVYHPVPFRSGTGLSRPGAVVPPSFAPSIKKSSPDMAKEDGKKENMAEENGNNNYLIFSKGNIASKAKKSTDQVVDVVLEPAAIIPEKEMKEPKEAETDNDTSKEATVNVPDSRKEIKEVNEVEFDCDASKERNGLSQTQTTEFPPEAILYPIPPSMSSETEEYQCKDALKPVSQPSETEENQWKATLKPVTQSSETEENQWKATLKPVSQPSETEENQWKATLKPVTQSSETEENQWKATLKPVSQSSETEENQWKATLKPVTQSSETEENQWKATLKPVSQSSETEENQWKATLKPVSQSSETEENQWKDSLIAESESETPESLWKAALKPVSQSSETPHENQWKVALKPVSRRIEDSQTGPVTVQPVKKPKVPTPRALFPRPKSPPRSEPNVQSEQTSGETEPVSLSQLAETKQIEEVESEDSKTNGADRSNSRITNTSSTESAESNEPVRGIPSIIANRLKQNAQKQNGDAAQTRSPGELFGVRLGKTHYGHGTDAHKDSDVIPHKRLTPAADKPPEDASSTSEIKNRFANVLRRKDQSNRNRPTGVSQIFDSSQLQKKRREKRMAKVAAASTLSGVKSGGGGSMGQNGGAAQEVQACNIQFIGANVSTGRSMLSKNRTVKINVRFHDVLMETFEYPSEEQMLQEYLKDHPDEVLVLEQVAGPTESSDDFDISELLRSGGLLGCDGDLLKSNTSLAHSGTLQSYRGKYQEDYELGSVLNLPDKPPSTQTDLEPVNDDPESMQIVPAPDDDLPTYSLDTSSDLLF